MQPRLRRIDQDEYKEAIENLPALVEAHSGLDDDHEFGFGDDDLIKPRGLDMHIDWVEWEFPWPGSFIEVKVKEALEG